jgi:ABC-type methionine transport system ATPase subunit
MCPRRIGGEIVLLHRGRVVENGPAEEFFRYPRTPEARSFMAGDLLVWRNTRLEENCGRHRCRFDAPCP